MGYLNFKFNVHQEGVQARLRISPQGHGVYSLFCLIADVSSNGEINIAVPKTPLKEWRIGEFVINLYERGIDVFDDIIQIKNKRNRDLISQYLKDTFFENWLTFVKGVVEGVLLKTDQNKEYALAELYSAFILLFKKEITWETTHFLSIDYTDGIDKHILVQRKIEQLFNNPDIEVDEAVTAAAQILRDDGHEKINIEAVFFDGIIDFACYEINEMINGNVRFKRCANCGRVFIPQNRSDTIYCDRVSPQCPDKTCKKYGAEQQHRKNLVSSEASGLYRKIYMSKQMLAKRNPDIVEYLESFEKFKSQSKQWKADVKAGTKTEEEFIEWLKSVKEKKVL